jgi:hypothetical protein
MDSLREKIGRREFLGNGAKIAVGASALTVASKTRKSKAASSGSNRAKAPKFILDSHIHCGGTEDWVEEMVKTYRPRNAMAFVLTWMKDMKLMKDAAADYPDVFIRRRTMTTPLISRYIGCVRNIVCTRCSTREFRLTVLRTSRSGAHRQGCDQFIWTRFADSFRE